MNGPPKDLVARRDRLLALPPRERIAAIEASRDAGALVRSLPAQDLFLTLATVGVDDALVLLEHASVSQLDFVLDLGAWNRDAFDAARFARWISAVAAAGPDRVARWLAEGDEATVVLALSRVYQVFKLDESSDPAYWPPDRPLPTLDGTYFLELRDDVPEEAGAALWQGLTRLRSTHSQGYESLLEQVMWAVPAEREEDAYERRASRLAERGFPPFDEAIEAWAAGPEADPEVRREAARRALSAASARTLAAGPATTEPARHLPAPLDEEASALAQAVAGLDPAEQRRVLSDLLRLGNRFAVAGLGDLAELETHREGLRIALSHAALGLHELGGARAAALGPALLAAVPVPELVRAGTGAVLQRAERARRLASGWLARIAGARERLDPESEEMLAALLLPRPRRAAPRRRLRRALARTRPAPGGAWRPPGSRLAGRGPDRDRTRGAGRSAAPGAARAGRGAPRAGPAARGRGPAPAGAAAVRDRGGTGARGRRGSPGAAAGGRVERAAARRGAGSAIRPVVAAALGRMMGRTGGAGRNRTDE
ncbi:MAG: DUF6178 family protein [Acidobacteria bacterium]|nr:DUF6178 family protein [Acidobacteriota bacterium]